MMGKDYLLFREKEFIRQLRIQALKMAGVVCSFMVVGFALAYVVSDSLLAVLFMAGLVCVVSVFGYYAISQITIEQTFEFAREQMKLELEEAVKSA